MIDDNEVAIDNRMRRAEKQNQSPINLLLEGAESASLAVGLATGSRTVGTIAKTFGIAKRFTSGLGVATLSENLDHLGDAAEAAFARVEARLESQGCQIEEIERRLNSPELLEGIKAATLQAQRTKDKKRLERMALILANGFAENDLEPESLDDMMRAAVELKDADIIMLERIYALEKPLLDRMDRVRRGRPELLPNLHGEIQNVWHNFGRSLNPAEQLEYRGSFARLQSHGLIQQVTISNSAVGQEPYLLLGDGAKLYERLQEIGVGS
jgi:hypothetical protein